MSTMTIFTPEWATPGTFLLRDVDRSGLQLAGRTRMGGSMPAGDAFRVGSALPVGSAMPAGVRMAAEAHARGFYAVVKQLKTPVVIGVNGEVGPHPGRPPI